MSYRRVNKAKLIPASCSTLVSLWFIYPSTCANFVYPKTKKKKKKNPRSHLKPLRVSVLTAGEPADKHRSVWLDSSGLHSSWALTLRSRCDPYVCWFYYEPSGNQWPETHLGAHPLVISLISLLALAIWVLSPGQWLSARRDWSGSSYRSLINGCGWGDGSFLFPSLFFSFSPLFARLWYRGVMYVMFPWGGPDDWHEPPGRPADWLAGRSSPTRGFDMDDTQTHTHTYSLHHTLSFLLSSVQNAYHGAILMGSALQVWKLNRSMILEDHCSPPGDPVDLLLARISLWITTVRETINQSSWKILTGFFLFHLQNILGLTIDRFSLKSRYLWRSFRKLIILHFPQCNMTVSCNTLCLKNGKFHVNALSNLKENSESWRKFWYSSLHCMMLKHGGRK